MAVVLYGILLAHFNSYKEYYMKIGVTFATTYIMKRVIKQGDKDHADLIGLGGYALTLGEFAKLMNAIKKSGIPGDNKEEATRIIGGFLGKGLDLLKDVFNK